VLTVLTLFSPLVLTLIGAALTGECDLDAQRPEKRLRAAQPRGFLAHAVAAGLRVALARKSGADDSLLP
jgi:hypothetical protein